jgi:hypothetical protein
MSTRKTSPWPSPKAGVARPAATGEQEAYGNADVAEQRRYSPAKLLSVNKAVIQGNPDERLISASYIERQNLTMRMHMRGKARCT